MFMFVIYNLSVLPRYFKY